MLYERWCQIARVYRDRTALIDLEVDQRWTFGQLHAAAEQQPGRAEGIEYPQGQDAGFILSVLAGWRQGRTVCPLEPGQKPPRVDNGLPEGVAHLKLTSATTGASRMVAFTAAQLAADAESIVLTMGLRADWPNLGVISLAHSYGFSNLVLPLLLQGIPLVLAGTPLPEMVKRASSVFPEITLPAVPALWRTWHDAGAILPNVRLAISAGAPMPLTLEEEVYKRHGLKIHNFYGSSECGGIAYDATPTPRPRATCAGTPMHQVEIGIMENGCVRVRGPAVGLTYFPEASPNLKNGVFETSDLGELDGGVLHLRGRAGDLINVAGRKVAPEVIERVLARHPGLRECLVFGAPSQDPERGEDIVACVVTDGRTATDALRDHALTSLPSWQVPRKWWVVRSLTPNQRGKVSRAEWRKRYLQEFDSGNPADADAPVC